ncbi:hypothetical protein AXK12_06155 [Cephaloticoccus capnophilus]|uniref:YtkA-like domain-containing protein n=1 Tax=Cephaloticoccus capnophilus TaxID=1548208 RepID=A0A139SKD1_9BACT|nr:hypothetical protein [Cephaloticoccus capnophilus]KXU34947.1 hypothetical protein AXK12_06155 [Cephaloticoccus capnophilus]
MGELPETNPEVTRGPRASRPKKQRSAIAQIGAITAVAVAVYVGFRVMPTGTNLSHMDFRVEGENTLQMCDPGNPQFLPVVNVRSPVSLALSPSAAVPRAGEEWTTTLRLTTYQGKAIGPADLWRVHTEFLHLMIIDPDLLDYHHIHPQPTDTPGEWQFSFTPRYGGEYRIFADFTPAATGLGLYASAQVLVEGAAPSAEEVTAAQVPSWRSQIAGVDFELKPIAEKGATKAAQAEATSEVRARREVTMRLALSRADGGEVPLLPIMDAFAHVVAFDIGRTGFAHLHPQETDLNTPPDPQNPALTFRVLIPSPGRYVAWAQVNHAGTERFAPFWFEVK